MDKHPLIIIIMNTTWNDVTTARSMDYLRPLLDYLTQDLQHLKGILHFIFHCPIRSSLLINIMAICDYLIGKNLMDINEVDENGQTVLFRLVHTEFVHEMPHLSFIIEELVEIGASLNNTDGNGKRLIDGIDEELTLILLNAARKKKKSEEL